MPVVGRVHFGVGKGTQCRPIISRQAYGIMLFKKKKKKNREKKSPLYPLPVYGTDAPISSVDMGTIIYWPVSSSS